MARAADTASAAQARYSRELPDAYERLILDVINVRFPCGFACERR